MGGGEVSGGLVLLVGGSGGSMHDGLFARRAVEDLVFLIHGIGDFGGGAVEVKVFACGLQFAGQLDLGTGDTRGGLRTNLVIFTAEGLVVEGIVLLVESVAEAVVGVFKVNSSSARLAWWKIQRWRGANPSSSSSSVGRPAKWSVTWANPGAFAGWWPRLGGPASKPKNDIAG